MTSFVVTSADRELFTLCRRAWDYGSGVRRALEPVTPLDGSGAVEKRAIRKALAVYYFPGMWSWDREIVLRLTRRAFVESGGSTVDLFDQYADWAPAVDTFTPIRVETDYEVNVPDPSHPERDLATPDGSGIHFSGRLPALVVGDSDEEGERQYVMFHRVFSDCDPPDREVLRLDEEAISACWAWERFQLTARLRGAIFNEIGLAGAAAGGRATFRRTTVELDRTSLDCFGRRLAELASAMSSPDLVLYPSPSLGHCSVCAFREPCLIEQREGDPEPLLASRFRRRAEPHERQAGRLGGVSWSMGRGAAPPTFRRRAP